MLSSVLSLLTVSAVVLVLPVFAGLLGMQRHRHLAVGEEMSRRVRLGVAATLVGLSALGLAVVLDAQPVPAAVVAVLMAGAVLAWAPLTGSWAVRGVVVWALLVTAAVGLLAWLVERMVTSTLPAVWLAVSATAWLLLLVSMVRVQRYARDLISAQAGLRTLSRRHKRISLVRPAVSLVVLFAAGGVVAVATTHGATPGRGRAPQAGMPGTYGVPPVAPSLTTAGPSTDAINLAAAIWRRGIPGLDARPRAAATIFGPSVLGPTSVGPTAVVPPLSGSGATSSTATTAAPSAGRTSPRSAPAGGGSVTAARPQTTASEKPRSNASPARTQAPLSEGSLATADEDGTDGPSATPEVRTSPSQAATSVIADPAPTKATRIPDYEKPNRPSAVPSAAPQQPESTAPPAPEPSAPQPSDSPASKPSDSPTSKPSDSPTSKPSEPQTNQPSDTPASQTSDPEGTPSSDGPGSKPSDSPGQSGESGSKPSDPPSQAATDRAPGQGKVDAE